MRLLAAAVVASLVMSAVPARAQDVISKESAAELKASVLGDLDTLHTKFVASASARPSVTHRAPCSAASLSSARAASVTALPGSPRTGSPGRRR